MLKYLNIANFAVIDRLEVDFQAGLNLLTGETGSGKSIIVDSLTLLLGGRASVVQVRTGERVAVVEGLFMVSGEREARARAVLAEAGIEIEAGEGLLIRREINASGRSRTLIGDESVTAATLRALQPLLVEIHGQGEQRSLLSTASQLDLLDGFAGCLALRMEVAEAFGRWKSARAALEKLAGEMADRERAGDLLQYQLTEIERVAPRPGEDEELEGEKKLLVHAERVRELGAGAYALLYEDDESVLARLSGVRRRLEDLNEIDARMGAALEALETSVVSLEDVAAALRHYGESLEFSPARLAQIDSRLVELERLKRKYNRDLRGVIEIRDELSERLRGLSDLTEREGVLKNELAAAEESYAALAEELSSARRRAARELATRVMADLRHVALEQARFIVNLETGSPEQAVVVGSVGAFEEGEGHWGQRFYTPYGKDSVEFLLSANPGETPQPLQRVASGGELSRLMLTLRTVGLTGESGGWRASETIIFDEIDTGIGGRVAEAVGRRLKALAASRQVLCVTHQPQIARFADRHYVVTKSVQNGRTATAIRELDAQERVGELARMIGGSEEEAQTTRETARWLLENAQLSVQIPARGARKRGRG